MLPPPPDAAAAAAMAATEAEEELALFLLKTDFLYERDLSPPPLDFSFSSTMLHEPRGDASPPPGLRGLNGVEQCVSVRYELEHLPAASLADIKGEMFRGDKTKTLKSDLLT